MLVGKGRLPATRTTLKVVDYYTVPWEDAPAGTPAVVMIVVYDCCEARDDLAVGWHLSAEMRRIDASKIAAHGDELERDVLESFASHVEANPKALWLHWGLDGVQYGFPALRQRMAVCDLTPVTPPKERCLDLAAQFKRSLGEDYVPHKRLPSLVQRNGINARGWMKDSADLTAALRGGRYADVMSSLRRKVRCISRVAAHYYDGTLRIGSDREVLAPAPVGGVAHLLRHARAARVDASGSLAAAVAGRRREEAAGPDANRCPVTLADPETPPRIHGQVMPLLREKQHRVVKALVGVWPRRLTKEKLAKASQCGDPLGILKRLKQSDPRWDETLTFPGSVGGGYRIVGSAGLA